MDHSTEKAVANANESITVTATTENVEKVTAFVEGILESYDVPMKAGVQINIAIDEIYSNIVKFAYIDPETGENQGGEATINVRPYEDSSGARGVQLDFVDSGNPYDPLLHKDPVTDIPAEERDVGGLGILIVKKQMDNVEYRYDDGCNILTITKLF